MTLAFRLVCTLLSITAALWAQAETGSWNGKLEALPHGSLLGDWTIGGRVVSVSPATVIDQERGPVGGGACLQVTAAQDGGAGVRAAKIEVRPSSGACLDSKWHDDDDEDVEFRGIIQSIASSFGGAAMWTVSGRKVQILSSTRIEPRYTAPAVGHCVEVKGELNSAGVVVAERIQGQGDGACKQPPGGNDEPKLIGTVQSLPPYGLIGEWKISNQVVRVTETTRIDMDRGIIQNGTCVEVRGPLQSGVIQSTRIETRNPSDCAISAPGGFQFYGLIETLPPGGRAGDWKIGGRTVIASTATTIDTSRGPIIIGACVGVEGPILSNGMIHATRIEVMSTSGACIFRNGIVDAGSLVGIAVAPSQVLSIFGLNIGPAAQVPFVVGLGGKVSTRLGNTRVLFDGVPGTILFVSSGQVNVVTPCSLAGKTSTAVRVETNGALSNAVTMPVLPAAPSLFTISGSGKGQAAVLNFDVATGYGANGPSNAAARNSAVILYGTGFGATNPACVDGAIINPFVALPRVTAPVTVTIGGRLAVVQYAGAAPGFVTGVYQVNAIVPPDALVGAVVPIVVTAGGKPSPDGVTIAVR
jgi:uncharacterized protein (TIGR03437 family)